MDGRKWIITFGGSGLCPVAPGTAGSLAAAALAAGLWATLGHLGGLSPISWNLTLAIGVLIFSILSVATGSWAVAVFNKKDPGPFVLDEVAGIFLTLLFLPLLPGRSELWALALAFVAFRIFDVTKPPPARQLERLPAGWGILMDYLAAAVYANLLCQVIVRGFFLT